MSEEKEPYRTLPFPELTLTPEQIERIASLGLCPFCLQPAPTSIAIKMQTLNIVQDGEGDATLYAYLD